ncbi:MAG: Na+/H+ antiporter NhaA [Dehalococcoidia bacterium]
MKKNTPRRQALTAPRLIVRPLQEFLRTETAGGVLLLLAAAAALAWANTPFASSYGDFWGAHLRAGVNSIAIDLSLRGWVNDALMAVFFYVVGLEIKREAIEGELTDWRRAALPVAAALGGMLVPAALYFALNAGGAGERGWGIPMATDIAFAVGVVALAGARVPASLKVFLLALAIVDDIGAIVVIALFYSDGISLAWLAAAAGIFALFVAMGRGGVRSVTLYLAAGVVAWLAVYESGVHATIAGVVLGLLTPVRPLGDAEDGPQARGRLMDQDGQGRAEELRAAANSDGEGPAPDRQPVLDRIEHVLHPWTSYLIVPVFALANAGIAVDGGALRQAVHSPVAVGVVLGLVAGKPVGVLCFAWLATRLGLAALPDGVRWPQVAAVAVVAGIGFTVSLFISALAFSDQRLVDEAKLGILGGSLLMGVGGYLALRAATRAGPA